MGMALMLYQKQKQKNEKEEEEERGGKTFKEAYGKWHQQDGGEGSPGPSLPHRGTWDIDLIYGPNGLCENS